MVVLHLALFDWQTHGCFSLVNDLVQWANKEVPCGQPIGCHVASLWETKFHDREKNPPHGLNS